MKKVAILDREINQRNLLLFSMLLLSLMLPACSRITLKPWYEDYSEVGYATWYGREHHMKKTASGERFDMYRYTAAHPTLPFGTIVLVTNLENGRSVKVRINDRGPFTKGRVIDLSYTAARKIKMIKKGIAKVKITILRIPDDRR